MWTPRTPQWSEVLERLEDVGDGCSERAAADPAEMSDCTLLEERASAAGSSGWCALQQRRIPSTWLVGVSPVATLTLLAGTLLLALVGASGRERSRHPWEAILGRFEVFGDAEHEAHPPLCTVGQMPNIAGANMDGTAMEVNVMSYNLFWWMLFDKAQGPVGHLQIQGNAATQLISQAIKTTPYDVLGFQECEDEQWLLSHTGMAAEYTIFRDRACCMAYRTKLWTLVGRGVNYVADDARFGMRPAQWMRLRHRVTGKIVFFTNHHGPLPISSGGMCGGYAHAFNLMKVFETHSQPGDTVVLVGDFNADPGAWRLVRNMEQNETLYELFGVLDEASVTIKLLAQRLRVVIGGWKSATHIDYIFTNAPEPAVMSTIDLGKGGSDHNALSAKLRIGHGAAKSEPPVVEANTVAGHQPESTQRGRLTRSLCSEDREDRFEYGISYVVAKGSGRLHFSGYSDQEQCCLKCRDMPKCKSFTFHQGGMCWLYGALPAEKKLQEGTVSGLPLREEEATEVYAEEVEESAEMREEEGQQIPSGAEPPTAVKRKAEYEASFGKILDQSVTPSAGDRSKEHHATGPLRLSMPAQRAGEPTMAPLPAPSPAKTGSPSSSPAFHISMPNEEDEPSTGIAGFFAQVRGWLR